MRSNRISRGIRQRLRVPRVVRHGPAVLGGRHAGRPYADFSAIAGAALDMTAGSRGNRAEGRGSTRDPGGHAIDPGSSRRSRRPAAAEGRRISNRGVDQFRAGSRAAATEPCGARGRLRTCAFRLTRSVASSPLPNLTALWRANWASRRAPFGWSPHMRGTSSARCGPDTRAAFVARPGKVLYPLAPAPDIVGADLRAVAEQIVARTDQRWRGRPEGLHYTWGTAWLSSSFVTLNGNPREPIHR